MWQKTSVRGMENVSDRQKGGTNGKGEFGA